MVWEIIRVRTPIYASASWMDICVTHRFVWRRCNSTKLVCALLIICNVVAICSQRQFYLIQIVSNITVYSSFHSKSINQSLWPTVWQYYWMAIKCDDSSFKCMRTATHTYMEKIMNFMFDCVSWEKFRIVLSKFVLTGLLEICGSWHEYSSGFWFD